MWLIPQARHMEAVSLFQKDRARNLAGQTNFCSLFFPSMSGRLFLGLKHSNVILVSYHLTQVYPIPLEFLKRILLAFFLWSNKLQFESASYTTSITCSVPGIAKWLTQLGSFSCPIIWIWGVKTTEVVWLLRLKMPNKPWWRRKHPI